MILPASAGQLFSAVVEDTIRVSEAIQYRTLSLTQHHGNIPSTISMLPLTRSVSAFTRLRELDVGKRQKGMSHE